MIDNNTANAATGGEYLRPRRPMPETTEGKLEDIIRRLGRIEKHLIDLKGNPPPPGRFHYQRDAEAF